MSAKCRIFSCVDREVRTYGWNAAKPNEPPRNVKARLCASHVRELRKTTDVVMIEKRIR